MPKIHKFTNSARHITAGRAVPRSAGQLSTMVKEGFYTRITGAGAPASGLRWQAMPAGMPGCAWLRVPASLAARPAVIAMRCLAEFVNL